MYIYYTTLSAVPLFFSGLEENSNVSGHVLQFRCETLTVSNSNKTHCYQLCASQKPFDYLHKKCQTDVLK